jgi:endoglucanase
LHADQLGSNNWHTLADWWSVLEGSGTHPAAISSVDNFYSNGCLVRTPANSNVETFGGASLTMNGGTMNVKSLSTTNATSIGNLVSYGGTIVNATGNIQILNISSLKNYGRNTNFETGGTAVTQGIDLAIGTLTGNGDLTLKGSGTLLVTINSALNYYGTIYTSGTAQITFENAFTTRGALIVSSGVTVTLNASITVSTLVVNDVARAAGTYSASSLGFGGSGSIVVKAPLALYLHAHQPGTDDWNTLADWWTTPTAGSHPASISSNDDFYTNNFQLRSPVVSTPSVFGGASLTINGGGVLLKNTSATSPTTIQNLLSTGGSIFNSNGGTQILNFTNFDNADSSLNLDTSTSTRGLNISAVTLSGEGNLALLGHGGGQWLLNIANANNYRGTITMSASSTGTLTFQNSLFSAGSLVVNAGNSVVVNKPVSFAGLTVGGVVKAAGTYSAPSLGFTGTGTVTVTNRPRKMYGVNEAGMEGSFYVIPPDASFAYYATKGLTLIRVPFKWERLQPTLNGALSAARLADMDTVLARAASHGEMVIFDMHNFGGFNGNQIGTTAVPYSAYQDVWTKLAAHFAASPNAASIYAYDIMNEPNASSLDWPTAAQYGINGVRAGDSVRFIMVEGQKYSSASQWPKVNAGLAGLVDSQKKLIYSAHCYFANANNDQYLSYDAEKGYPNMGVDKVAPFVEWCKAHKVYGHIGEYGVPNNDPRWNVVLQNFLQYLSDNDISGTYWSANIGPTYPLSCEPTSNYTVDRPQMAVLQLFHQ